MTTKKKTKIYGVFNLIIKQMNGSENYALPDLRLDYQPNDKNIRDFIGDRVMPEERHGLNSILEGLGLDFYDPWEICKKCHGCSHEDYWWLKKEGDNFNWREYHQIS
ncbi:TPA: hypothetical protein KOD12_000594 [Clostridioides difficile]|nr:hypothetical protein [Clostridioides difficile]HBF3532452.1 hypothetical protein [Clostridioides difficile]